jgi:competence protein ComEC
VNKITQLLWSTVSASIAAEVLVAPLVIYYFHNFPLLFIISNVLAYVFMSVVLILSIAIIVLSCIPVLAQLIGIVAIWVVSTFDNIVFRLQNCSPVSFHFITLSIIELLIVYAAITSFILFLLKKQKSALFTGMVITCVLLCFFCKDQWVRLHQQHFVVYNAGRSNVVEVINGPTYALLNTDTSQKINYNLKPVHTNWQAWDKGNQPSHEVFDINNKTILVLDTEVTTDQAFPVDYLVLNYTCQPDLVALQRMFSPSLIIAGNNYSLQQQEQLAQTALYNHIAIHITRENGAFVR